jgi:16S rRNA (guanine527-N7)-methyltransferase
VSAPLDAAGFAGLVDVSRETLARLETYAELLRRWSARINLVGRDTLGDLWRRHILDSAQLMRLVPNQAAGLVDLGSGAGLPGLILAILGVTGVELIEADRRKCAFLGEAARITGTAIRVHPCRIEAVPRHPVAVVTARACAPLDRLLALAQRFLGPGSRCLFLKGERVAAELTAARRNWTMTASLHPSHSDPRGVILCLDQAACEPAGRPGCAEGGGA